MHSYFLVGVFCLLGLIMLATAFGCWAFRLEEANELIRISVTGIVLFLLPVIGEVIVAGIMLMEILVKQAISER
ncbi:hypothetical protein Lac2_25850 [Claveliimonas bilis]|nr:hypothetical protein Lac2_25850 [Claveliimonas bilis]